MVTTPIQDLYQRTLVIKPINAVVVTSETAIWTPASGKRFRLMGFVFAVGVVAGNVTIRDGVAGTTIMIFPGVLNVGPEFCLLPFNGYESSAVGNVLTAQGAATETLSGFVFGYEE